MLGQQTSGADGKYLIRKLDAGRLLYTYVPSVHLILLPTHLGTYLDNSKCIVHGCQDRGWPQWLAAGRVEEGWLWIRA